MAKKKRPQFGNLPPQHRFILNPYPDARLTSCPSCNKRTGQRKRALMIHIDPNQMVALNYTCRYCKECDLLIAHKHEIEHLLATMMKMRAPEFIGNNYLIIGILEQKAWKAAMQQERGVAEMLDYVSDFAEHYDELRVTETGWFGPGQQPGIRQPPPSQEWVKQRKKKVR